MKDSMKQSKLDVFIHRKGYEQNDRNNQSKRQ